MNRQKRLYGFDFYDYPILHEQIYTIATIEVDGFVSHRELELAEDLQAFCGQFVS